MTNVTWPSLPTTHPLVTFCRRLPTILDTTDYHEVWGVDLSLPDNFNEALSQAEANDGTISQTSLPPVPVLNVLQKFLRANKNDLEAAAKQLQSTLEWRKSFNPKSAAFEETFDDDAFGGLGYITKITDKEGKDAIVVWNIYGAVKDKQKTFGDLDRFLRWRIGLMERCLAPLSLSKATVPIPDYSATTPTIDPYQCIQVHDYLNVSFLRMDPVAKTASKATIALMSEHYPELLSRKFFVNVPVVMQWMFTAMKMVLAKETVAKFVVVSYGENLALELGDNVPKEYGGKGSSLREWNEKEVAGESDTIGPV